MEIEERYSISYARVWHKKDQYYEYHREDGPAVIWPGGREDWYLDAHRYECPKDMPLNLFLAYVKWELKKHGN
jgi:hypothetical protein